jgi:hypothetical protein
MLCTTELFWVSSNDLTGTIPETIGSLVNLESLDLAFNSLSGTIPETIGSLVNLESLYLLINRLGGTIPETMGSLVNLEYLDLDFNSFNGTIPETMESLVNLDAFAISLNDLTGEIPQGLCEIRRKNNIEDFQIDCKEVACDCCFDYCTTPPRILNPTSPNCPEGTTLLQVATGTDQDPEGVEWEVVDESTNETLLQGGPWTQDDVLNTILEETCVPNDACLVFTIRGSNGDGYLKHQVAGDRFMVHLNGSEVSNGRFEDFQMDEGFFFGKTSSCIKDISHISPQKRNKPAA